MMPDYQEFGWASAEAQCSDPYVTPVMDAVIGAHGEGNSRVLDVGCGNGHFAGRLAVRGFEVVGVDLSDVGVAIARRTHPSVRFERLAADDQLLTALGAAPFDLVVSTEVIEHVYDAAAFVAGCFGALRPGGRLILSTPYHGVAKVVLIALTGHLDDHFQPARVGGHIKFFSKASITALLEAGGFEDVGFRGAGRVPLLWKSMVVSARRPPASR